MARPCAVCVHDSRLAIEQAILARKPASAIARNFGFTYTRRSGKNAGQVVADHRVITRHRDDHMGVAYQKAVDDAETQSGNAIAARMAYLDEQVTHVIEHARKGTPVLIGDVPLLDDDGRQVLAYDHRILLRAVAQGRANAEVLLKLAGRTEHDPMALDRLRAQLQDPKARKLLADLDALMASLESGQTTPQ